MSTPDHHPYLTDGDLRTAEDVLEWIDTLRRDAIEGRALLAPSTSFGPPVRGADADAVMARTVHALHRDLAERLDRERRQACRRGALRTFRHLAWYARVVRRGREYWELDDPAFSSEMAWEYAVDCLAFRAAARAR